MTSKTSIETQVESPHAAKTFPSREVRTGASSGAFSLSKNNPIKYKEISTKRNPETEPFVSSATRDAIDKASGTTSTVKSTYQMLPVTSHPASIVADQVAGEFGSVSTVFLGVLKIGRTGDKVEKSQAIGDEAGEHTARLEKVTGVFQTLAGATGLGVKSTRIATALVANKRLMAGAATLSFIGGILSVILNSLFLGWSIRQSRRASHFYEEYSRQGKTFDALVGSIYVSSDKMRDWINNDSSSLRITGEAVLKKASFDDLARLRFAHLDPARKMAMWSTLVQRFAQENLHLPAMAEFYFSQLSDRDIDSLDLPAALGLLLKVSNQQLTNEAHFEQAFGSDCLNQVKKAAERGLQARLKPTALEAVHTVAKQESTELLAKIDASYQRTQRVYRSTAILSSIGIVLGILGFLTLGPIGAAIMVGLGIVYNLGFAVQSCLTAEEFKGPVGRYDKALIYVFMALAVLGIATAITVFCIFGGGPIVAAIFAVALVAALASLCIYGYSLHQLNKQEKEWKAAVATREQRFIDDLDSDSAQNRLRRAVKRTTTFIWKQWWYSNKNKLLERQALALQEMLTCIEQANMKRAKHIYQHIVDKDVKEKLQGYLEYFHTISASKASVEALSSDAADKLRSHQFKKTA